MASRSNGKVERVSYTFPSVTSEIPGSFAHPSANNCHCSGVNAIAVDATRSIMYSAGRDSSIRAWSFGNHQTLKQAKTASSITTFPLAHETVSFYHMDYHSDWVNDLALAYHGTRLVSCGSDHKIVVSDVSGLFEDPWSPMLAQSYESRGQALNGDGEVAPTNGLGAKTEKELKPAGLRYSHQLAHNDYVKKVKCELTEGDESMMVFSVGLDARLKIHAMRPEGGSLTMLQTYDTKTSMYALATRRNNSSWLVATGGTDGLIKVFDTREDKKCVFKLKGHSDIVKTLLMPSSRPNLLVSGGADSSIRIWDLRNAKQQSCLALHEDSVWTLSEVHQTASSQDHLEFYSGGRDGSVYWTNVDTSETRFLFKEPFPILSLAPVRSESLWVSTTDPSITQWEISAIASDQTSHRPSSLVLASSPIASPGALSLSPTLGNMLEVAQLPTAPLLTTQQAISKTPTRPSLISHHILPDKHRVLTRDSAGRAQIWNIVQLKIEKDFGIVSETTEAILASIPSKRFLPGWFTAETRSGQLTIHIDPYPRCTDANFYSPASIYRYGADRNAPLDLAVANAFKAIFKGYFAESIANHSKPVSPSESTNPTSSATQTETKDPLAPAEDGENNEKEKSESKSEALDVIVTVTKDGSVMLREHSSNITRDTFLPEWVTNVVTEPRMRPATPALSFYFTPKRKSLFRIANNPEHQFVMHRSFTAWGMAEYLVSKAKDTIPMTRQDVVVYLQDIVIPHTMDLGSIKHFYWKSSEPMPLSYDYE